MITEAKQIPDEKFLDAVEQIVDLDGWANRWAVKEKLEELLGEKIPEKVFLAKARKLILAKKMNGCYCGCRGDYEPPFEQVWAC